jgi:Na+/melibiose symporter-like transporter
MGGLLLLSFMMKSSMTLGGVVIGWGSTSGGYSSKVVVPIMSSMLWEERIGVNRELEVDNEESRTEKDKEERG